MYYIPEASGQKVFTDLAAAFGPKLAKYSTARLLESGIFPLVKTEPVYNEAAYKVAAINYNFQPKDQQYYELHVIDDRESADREAKLMAYIKQFYETRMNKVMNEVGVVRLINAGSSPDVVAAKNSLTELEDNRSRLIAAAQDNSRSYHPASYEERERMLNEILDAAGATLGDIHEEYQDWLVTGLEPIGINGGLQDAGFTIPSSNRNFFWAYQSFYRSVNGSNSTSDWSDGNTIDVNKFLNTFTLARARVAYFSIAEGYECLFDTDTIAGQVRIDHLNNVNSEDESAKKFIYDDRPDPNFRDPNWKRGKMRLNRVPWLPPVKEVVSFYPYANNLDDNDIPVEDDNNVQLGYLKFFEEPRSVAQLPQGYLPGMPIPPADPTAKIVNNGPYIEFEINNEGNPVWVDMVFRVEDNQESHNTLPLNSAVQAGGGGGDGGGITPPP